MALLIHFTVRWQQRRSPVWGLQANAIERRYGTGYPRARSLLRKCYGRDASSPFGKTHGVDVNGCRGLSIAEASICKNIQSAHVQSTHVAVTPAVFHWMEVARQSIR